jgi:hypothetical protein
MAQMAQHMLPSGSFLSGLALVNRNQPKLAAVLWNRNDLLRFRFRLWKSFGSGFGSGSDSGSGSRHTYYSFPKTTEVHKILPFLFQKQLISQKVGLSF